MAVRARWKLTSGMMSFSSCSIANGGYILMINRKSNRIVNAKPKKTSRTDSRYCRQNSKKLIILACHHPFKSNGVHGGFFTLKQHLFPFTDIFHSAYIPLTHIGSIYPIARSVFGTPQDLETSRLCRYDR